jgi:DNA replication licensing factor MCM4
MSSPPVAPSSPPQDNYGPNEQLRNEAAASQEFLQPTDNTIQNSSQRPPASSPLFFQSSPAANADADGMSSPIRAESALPSDGGPTPRASGQTVGGAPASTNYAAGTMAD